MQITRGVTHEHPIGRAWGNNLAFSSSQDLAATGNTTRQIFLFNLAYYDCFNGTTKPDTPCADPLPPYLRQITFGGGTPNNPTVSESPTGLNHQYVLFDAAGSFAAGGLTPLPGAAGAKRQIFKLDLTTNAFERMTSAADGDSEKPSVNGGGGIFLFESTAKSISDRPNATGTRQVYLYDWRNGGGLKRVSFARNLCGASGTDPCPTLGKSSGPSIDDSGKHLAFESTADLLGNGQDTGVPQIFFATYDKGQTNQVKLYQVTRGNGASRNAVMAEGGRLLAFETVATDLPGSPVGISGSRIVVVDMNDPTRPVFMHVTHPNVYGECHWPALNPTADDAPPDTGSGFDVRIAMICTGDPLQNDTTGNRVFVFASRTNTLYQLTGSGDVRGPLAANLGRWFVSFASDGDLTLTGACGYQIYSLNYNTDVISGVVPWHPATGIGEVPPDAASTGGTTTIGQQTFEVVPGLSPGGSTVTVTTRDGIETNPVVYPVSMGLKFGAPSAATGVADITVEAGRFTLPPVPLGNGFALCFGATGDGVGKVACTGDEPYGDVVTNVDHLMDDPSCLVGCRENDPACQGVLTGPHKDAGGTLGACNQLPTPNFGGTYADGGALVSVPASFSLSIEAGLDAVACTSDDFYATTPGSQVPWEIAVPTLRLMTGASTSRILDRDAELSQVLEVSESGAPFSCTDLRLGNLGGARLVGAVPILDVPFLPQGMRDVIVGFDLVAARGVANGCGASCSTSADCDDGNACNGAEFCGTNFLCVPGAPPTCDDGLVCNGAESCDPEQGCVPGTACNDGNDCNGVETCDESTGCTQVVPPVVCGDNGGGVCDGTEHCDPTSGLCVGGTPLDCDDRNSCTDDFCDPVTGCSHTPVQGGCNDGSGCTIDDQCSPQGLCVGTPVVCPDADGDLCTGAPVCNSTGAQTHTCVAAPPPTCNDNNGCTTDSCDPLAGCVYTPNSNTCNDGNACTTGDVCAGGSCTGTPKSCPDNGNVCDGVPACNPASGACVNGPPVSCEDGDSCTVDSCNPGTGACDHVDKDPGQSCDDGNACTGPVADPDVCTAAGTCTPGSLVSCDDGNPCTLDGSCDPSHGCPVKTAKSCDDNNACTDDFCDPVSGCQNVANTADCSDGNACTGTPQTPDRCVAKACEPGAAVSYDDGNDCNGVETCDPVLGRVPGAPPSCDDANACTTDSCEAGGCVHQPLDGAFCNDGNACTTGDVCAGGMCDGTPVSCNDDDVCDGTEACDPLTGACRAGTPLSCDDGDECTIDLACDPTAGCAHERKPNFVLCRLESLITTVRSIDPTDLGGRKRQAVLLRRLAGARKRAQMGLIGSGGRAVKNLGRAEKRVQSFVGLVQAGVLRGRIQSSRGQQLVALAADTQSEIVKEMRTR